MLEEMPPFPERDSSILAKLKKKRPQAKEETMEPRETKALPAELGTNSDHIPTKPIESVSAKLTTAVAEFVHNTCVII